MRIMPVTLLIAALSFSSNAALVLDLSPVTLADLQGTLKIEIHGDLTTRVVNSNQVFDCGTNGYLVIPSFTFPQDSFSVETYFCLRNYSQTDPYISSVIASIAWDGTNSYGIDLRVGGGNHYPLLPVDAYSDQNDYIQPDGITRLQRAMLSRCMPAFVAGGLNSYGGWKEDYSKWGICPGKWYHLVGTCLDNTLHIYLNGKEVTDNWRVNGAGFITSIPSQRYLVIGAEGVDGVRHTDGLIQFARIHDKVLSKDEIAEKYESIRGKRCSHTISCNQPLAGQGISEKTPFNVEIDHDSANSSAGTRSDSITVSIFSAADPFSPKITARTVKNEFNLQNLFPAGTDCLNVTYVSIKSTQPTVLAKTAALGDIDTQETWLPLFLKPVSAVIVNPLSAPALALKNKKSPATGRIYDLQGRRLKGLCRPALPMNTGIGVRIKVNENGQATTVSDKR